MKQGWEYKKLGEVCNILNGYAFKSSKYTNYGTRIIRITNVQKGFVVDNDPKYYSDDDIKDLTQYSLFEGDLVMSLTGNVGRVGMLKKCMLPAALNQRVACLRIKSDEIQLQYLFHVLNSDNFEKIAILSARGIAQLNMSTEWLKEYCIPLPPKSIQLAIVSELDKINELIRLKKEQLKDYDNLAQSIFYEMFGDPVENEKGWEVKKLSSLFKVSSSKRIMQEEWTKEGVPFLKVSDIVSLIKHGKVSPSTFISKLKFKKLEEAKMVPTVGDILITSRGTLGLCYIIKTDDKFYFQDGMVTWLSENTGDIIPIYITYVFSNNHFLEVLAGRANKSTVSYISIKQISKKEITVPPLPLQHLFAQRIEHIERQKSAVQKSITDLETLLASRMQYWFE